MYTIKSKHTMNSILYYEVQDVYNATNFNPIEENKVKNVIKDSFKLFSDEFNKRKPDLGIIDYLPYPSGDEFHQVFLSLLSTMIFWQPLKSKKVVMN